MNILGDFTARVNNLYPDMDNEEINSLVTTITNQETELEIKEKEIEKLKSMVARLEKALPAEPAPAKKAAEPKKAAPAKKAPAKKAEPKKEVKKAAPAKKAPAKKASKK